MTIVKCKKCNVDFYAKPNWLKKGWGKYCSRKCSHESNRKGKTVQCFICKKDTYKSQKALDGSKSKKYFCSKSCQTIWRNSIVNIGIKHHNWIDGRYTHKNILTKSNILKICTLCKSKDERILAVHHIDKNHINNDLKNLAWLCHNCHFLVHNHARERKIFTEIISAKI